MKKRKICVITGSRAEYGLLYWVIKSLHEDPQIELQLIATGMHLSPEFGLTYRQIEEDGFIINGKAEILLSSDTPTGISKSMGLGNILFAELFANLSPDLILVLGDRFEIFAAVTSAMVARIPVAHCHGGELTVGAIDNAFRHAITKMSHIHFTATETYHDRVIQMGEQPETVVNVGALGIENINKLKLLSRDVFEESIGFKLKKRNLVITFHPVTLDKSSSEIQFSHLLRALSELDETGLIFTMPNADTDGRIVTQMINDFVGKNKSHTVAFDNLGQLRYLSALKHADGVIGNSSSGIIEAPSLKTGTVNIGDRQYGRIKASSVIDCDPEYESIKNAIRKLFSNDFQHKLDSVKNPYDNGDASDRICNVIKSVKLNKLIKKQFYDRR